MYVTLMRAAFIFDNQIPLALGESTSKCTADPPALSPNMVTLFGSPPKCPTFFLTHFSARTMSFNPAFPVTPTSGLGKARKPEEVWFTV